MRLNSWASEACLISSSRPNAMADSANASSARVFAAEGNSMARVHTQRCLVYIRGDEDESALKFSSVPA
jgi:hypothetical protein